MIYNNISLLDQFTDEQLNSNCFLNDIWKFYFGLIKGLHDKNINIVDDITVKNYVLEIGKDDKYKEYGEFNTIKEIMDEVKNKEDNLHSYYANIKKYELLKKLVELFGKKVVQNEGNYDYHKMTKEQLYLYWDDKMNQLSIDGEIKYDEYFLLEDLDFQIDEWDKNPNLGLPFFKSNKMSEICDGWAKGCFYILGGFSGSGKTSLAFNKIVMSAIQNQEKTLIIANEQSINEYRKILFSTAIGEGLRREGKNHDLYFKRQRMNKGNFTEEEKRILKDAKKWINDLINGKENLIAFVFMESYEINDVKKIIKRYANRGYKRLLVDTGKPSEGTVSHNRWAEFYEDMKEIYKLTRPNGGGLNLSTWVNVQLSDSALKQRFLNEHALGESKKIKNEADVLFLMRNVWSDEREGEKKELKCIKWIPTNDPNHFEKEYFALPKEQPYFLLFTSKNRRGKDNKTGLNQLILKPNFNFNTWDEIGWTTVMDDHSY